MVNVSCLLLEGCGEEAGGARVGARGTTAEWRAYIISCRRRGLRPGQLLEDRHTEGPGSREGQVFVQYRSRGHSVLFSVMISPGHKKRLQKEGNQCTWTSSR